MRTSSSPESDVSIASRGSLLFRRVSPPVRLLVGVAALGIVGAAGVFQEREKGTAPSRRDSPQFVAVSPAAVSLSRVHLGTVNQAPRLLDSSPRVAPASPRIPAGSRPVVVEVSPISAARVTTPASAYGVSGVFPAGGPSVARASVGAEVSAGGFTRLNDGVIAVPAATSRPLASASTGVSLPVANSRGNLPPSVPDALSVGPYVSDGGRQGRTAYDESSAATAGSPSSLPLASSPQLALTRLQPTSDATYTWTGSTTNWSTAGNWGGTVPGSGDTANFATTGSSTPTLAANQSVSGITYASNANAYTIGGGSGDSLTIGSNGITQSSSNLESIGVSSLVLAASQTWTVGGSGGLTISAPITTSSNLTTMGIGTVTLSGVGSSLTGTTYFNNTATVIAGGSGSSYASLTTGIAYIASAYNQSVATVTVSGTNGSGTPSSWSTNGNPLYIAYGYQGTGALNVLGGGSVTSGGAQIGYGNGTVTVSGASTSGVASSWNTGGGTINVGYSGASDAGSLNISAGGTVSSGSVNIGTSSFGTVTVSGVNSVTGAPSSLNTNGGGIGLAESGPGTLNVLNGGYVTTGSGTTTVGLTVGSATLNIDGGNLTTNIVSIGTDANSPPAIALTNPSSAINGSLYALNIGGSNGSSTIGLVIMNSAGAGGIDKLGTGTLTLSGANTFSGGMRIDGGSVILSNTLALQNSTAVVNVANGLSFSTLTAATVGGLSGSGGFALSNSASTPAAVAVTVGGNNASTIYSGVLSGIGSLTKTGTGTLDLQNFNTYTGLTTVNAGTLSLDATVTNLTFPYGATLSTNSTGLLIDGGGTVNIAQSFQIPQNLPVTVADSSSGNAATLNFTSAISQVTTLNLGNGSQVTGTAGTNGGYTAALVLVDNTTTVGSIPFGSTSVTSGAASATISAPVGIQDSATLNIGSGSTLTISGVVSDWYSHGALVKNGAGTLTLTGANTNTGLTTVNAGTLNLNANFGGGSPYGATLSTNGVGLLINGGGTVNIAQSYQIPQNLPVTLADSSGGNAATLNFTGSVTQLNTLNLGNGSQITGSAGTNGIYSAAIVLIDNTTSVGSIATGTTTVTTGAATATIRAPVGIQDSANLNVGAGSLLAISGRVSDWFSNGALVKSGTGTLTLTGANTYSGGTTINAGSVVAAGNGLGSGAVSITGGALSVGEAANSTTSATSVGTLTVASLSVAASVAAPELTFNLGASGTNDMLTIMSGSSNAFAAAGVFEIGFASATGQPVSGGTYTLMTFSDQTSTTNLPTLSDYKAVGTGNVSDVVNPLFTYVLNGGQETLVLNDAGTDATPEPSALLLLAPAGVGLVAYRRRKRHGVH